MSTKLETRNSKPSVETRRSKVEICIRSIVEFPNAVSRWVIGLVMVIGSTAFPGVAFAQGCALCANNASALKAAALAALRNGILILLVPPVLIFIAIFVLAFRSRERFDEGDSQDLGLDRELNERLSRLKGVEATTLPGGGRRGDSRLPAEEYAAKTAAPPEASSWK